MNPRAVVAAASLAALCGCADDELRGDVREAIQLSPDPECAPVASKAERVVRVEDADGAGFELWLVTTDVGREALALVADEPDGKRIGVTTTCNMLEDATVDGPFISGDATVDGIERQWWIGRAAAETAAVVADLDGNEVTFEVGVHGYFLIERSIAGEFMLGDPVLVSLDEDGNEVDP